MVTEYAFVEGVDPESVRARELAISQRKSIAARNAHQKRRTRIIQVFANLQVPQENARLDVAPSSTGQAKTFQFSNVTQDSYRAKKVLQSSRSDPRAGRRPTYTLPTGRTRIEPQTISTDRKLYLPMLSQPTGPLHMAFSHEFDRRTFALWREQTATMSVRYSPKFAGVWLTTVPAIAMEFPAVRHNLLAHGLAYERIVLHAATETEVPGHEELLHYNAGIKAMSSGPSSTVFLAAAMLAYCYEAMKNNYQTAIMHLQGVRALIGEVSTTDSTEVRELKSYLSMLIKVTLDFNPDIKIENAEKSGEGEFFFRDREKEQSFDTVAEGRDQILKLLDKALACNENADEIEPTRLALADWFFTVRNWDLKGPATLDRDVIMLLFNLAVSQSPSEIGGALSAGSASENLQMVLQDIDKYLSADHQSKATINDMTFVLETLLIVCRRVQALATCIEIEQQTAKLIQRIRDAQIVRIKTSQSP